MGARKTTLPNIPDPNDHNLVECVQVLKEIIEVGLKDIRRGDKLDAFVTYRDLVDGSSITDIVSAVIGGGGLTLGGGDRPGDGSDFPGGVDPTDNYLPGRATNVQTNAVFNGIMVKWDWPNPADPNISWARAAIWVSATPQFADGALQGYSTSNFWVDSNVGLSDAEGETGVRYYWVRFEDFDQQTNELETTDWSPYSFENGIRGQTALNTQFTVDTFTVSCGDLLVSPFVCGEIVTGYTEGGVPIIEQGVGLDGQLIVAGTITADQLQAGIIGAELINAQEVWAEIATTQLLITQGFTTRNTLDYRLEINGWGGTKQNFPLWYGRGTTGGDEGLFWLQHFFNDAGDWVWSSFFLSGEMIVTGAGKFFAGNVLYDQDGAIQPDPVAARIEIGGPDTDFLLWAGSGPTGVSGVSAPIFYIDNSGNAVFNGTVEAKYVSGEISRTRAINEFDGEGRIINLPDHSYNNVQSLDLDATKWVTLGEWELGSPPFDYGHLPTFQISYNAFGIGFNACYSRVQMIDDQDPGGEWQTLNSDVVESNQYGGQHLLFASGWRIYGRCRWRIQLAKFNPGGASSLRHNYRTGLVLGVR